MLRFVEVWKNLPLFVSGLSLTLEVAVSAMIIGFTLGLLASIAQMSGLAPLRWIARTYIEIIRNSPALVQLFILYYGLPELGIRLPALPSLIVALGVNNGAYLAEIFRGGLQSVPRGQSEAAAAIGLSRPSTFFWIVLPQAVRAVVPATTNQCVQVVLAASLGTVVGVAELTNQSMFIISRTFRTWEVLIVLSLGYAALTWTVSLIGSAVGWRLERAFR